IRAAIVNDKTGNLVGVKSLKEEATEVIIISTHGQTIRLGLKDIPSMGRTTQGVRIMRLNDGDSVASMALVDKVDEDETEEGGEESEDAQEGPDNGDSVADSEQNEAEEQEEES